MKKVQVVVRRTEREQLLQTLQDLGVLHVVPINASQAVVDAETATSLDNVRRAVQILAMIEMPGSVKGISAQEAAEETMAIQRTQTEYDTRLSSLYRQLERQEMWGDVTLESLKVLESSGVLPDFYVIPEGNVDQVKAEFVSMIGDFGDGKAIVAVIHRIGEAQIPKDAEVIPVPSKDNPSIRAEATEIDAERKKSAERLVELAGMLPKLQSLQLEMEEQVQSSVASNGALTDEDLFAIQGWIPIDQSDTLLDDLETRGITAGIRALDPEEEEKPPTLIKYPKMVSPIKGLFDILNTFPGYRELDLSVFFMIAMPIFAAMLIGDGGYGLLFLLIGVFMYRKLVGKIGTEVTRLIIIIGVVTLVWGILSANFFGVSPETMARAGDYWDHVTDEADYAAMKDASGDWASVGNFMIDIAPLWKEDAEDSRELLIQISFLLGSLHLVTAHFRRILAIWPDQRALADMGWSMVLLGMLGVIWTMFFVGDGEDPPVPSSLILGAIAGGLVFVILFGSPDRNPIKRILVGFASALLPTIGAFGDTMSYIRLMAVGMASYYIAVAFNDLGAMIADTATWVAAVPLLLFGHALNIILVTIAIFAHGVRLNMLEFSSHCNVEWSGYAYDPFARIKT